MVFKRKRIEVTFELGKGSFGESGFNSVAVSGTRCSVTVVRGGGSAFSLLDLRIWGLKLSTMNELVTVGAPQYRTRKNKVTIKAGEEDGPLSVVFSGTIITAWVNSSGMPDVCLEVSANAAQFEAMKRVPGLSVKGGASAEVLLQQIASQIGYSLQFTGSSPVLSDPHIDGTAVMQIEQICDAAGLNFVLENDVLAVYPRNGFRGGIAIPVNKDTGMVGYPGFTQQGISVTTLFNPEIVFMGRIQVTSALTPVNGVWVPYSMVHELDAEMPDGKWFSHMECLHVGQQPA